MKQIRLTGFQVLSGFFLRVCGQLSATNFDIHKYNNNYSGCTYYKAYLFQVTLVYVGGCVLLCFTQVMDVFLHDGSKSILVSVGC